MAERRHRTAGPTAGKVPGARPLEWSSSLFRLSWLDFDPEYREGRSPSGLARRPGTPYHRGRGHPGPTSIVATEGANPLDLPAEDRAPLDATVGPREVPSDPRQFDAAIWGFVGLGLALRLASYLLNFPLWWDEAFVAVNLLRRGYLGLLRPLDYGQVCPLLFLWAELTSVRWLGFSEWSLRLFPLACALASVVLFRFAASQVLQGRALLLAVAVFAVSVHPIRHAADVKPYATDLLVALGLQSLAISWWRRPDRPGRLWALAGFVPFALLLSHPAAFVAGGVGPALVVPAWRTRRRSVRLAFAAYGMAMVATYALIYVGFTRAQASSASPGMREMWVRSFPPLDSIPWFPPLAGRRARRRHAGVSLRRRAGRERP